MACCSSDSSTSKELSKEVATKKQPEAMKEEGVATEDVTLTFQGNASVRKPETKDELDAQDNFVAPEEYKDGPPSLEVLDMALECMDMAYCTKGEPMDEYLTRLREDGKPYAFNDWLAANGMKGEPFENVKVDTQGFVAMSILGKEHPVLGSNFIIVSFRGTESWTDAVQDLKFLKYGDDADEKGIQQKLGEPRVHCGFHMAISGVQRAIVRQVKDYMETDFENNWTVYFVGHSLGGALASLCAYRFATKQLINTGRMNIVNITAGQPRVGNRMYAERFNVAVPSAWRLVNDEDVVTCCPKINYWHCGHHLHLNGDGTMHVDPGVLQRLWNKTDDVWEMLTGEAFTDHLLAAYFQALWPGGKRPPLV